MKKLIRISLLGLPLIVVTLLVFADNYEYLSCLIEHQSRENTADYCTIAVGAEGATTITTVDADTVAAHLTMVVDGDITLKPAGGNVTLHDGSNNVFDFDVTDPTFKIMDDTDQADYLSINVGASGATTITTVDAGATVAHLTYQSYRT